MLVYQKPPSLQPITRQIEQTCCVAPTYVYVNMCVCVRTYTGFAGHDKLRGLRFRALNYYRPPGWRTSLCSMHDFVLPASVYILYTIYIHMYCHPYIHSENLRVRT